MLLQKTTTHTIAGAILFALFAGCASTPTTVNLEAVPPLKSEGTLEVSMKDEKNTTIALRVHDLAKPTTVGATAYVAWAIPVSITETPKKVGALALEDGALGKLDATIAMTDFWLIVTAEPSPFGRAPMGAQIFSAEIRRIDDAS